MHPIFRVGGVGGGGGRCGERGGGWVPYFSYKTRPMYHRCIIEMSCTGILANNGIFKKTRILIYLAFSLVKRDLCEQFLVLKRMLFVFKLGMAMCLYLPVRIKK